MKLARNCSLRRGRASTSLPIDSTQDELARSAGILTLRRADSAEARVRRRLYQFSLQGKKAERSATTVGEGARRFPAAPAADDTQFAAVLDKLPRHVPRGIEFPFDTSRVDTDAAHYVAWLAVA